MAGQANADSKERRLRYPLLWLAFIAAMFAGAGLLLSPVAWRQYLGIALLCAPLLLLGALSMVYYLRQRHAPPT